MDILKVQPGPDSSLPGTHGRGGGGEGESTPGAVPSGYSGCPGSDYQKPDPCLLQSRVLYKLKCVLSVAKPAANPASCNARNRRSRHHCRRCCGSLPVHLFRCAGALWPSPPPSVS